MRRSVRGVRNGKGCPLPGRLEGVGRRKLPVASGTELPPQTPFTTLFERHITLPVKRKPDISYQCWQL